MPEVNKFSGLNVGDKISFEYPDSKQAKKNKIVPVYRIGTIVEIGENKKDGEPYIKMESPQIEERSNRPASTFRSESVIGKVQFLSGADGSSGFVNSLKNM